MQKPTPKRPSILLTSFAGMLGALLLMDQTSRAEVDRPVPCPRCGQEFCLYEVGINLAGAEFGPHMAGREWPEAHTLDYWQSRGIRLVRLPFKWEPLQPTLLEEFDPALRDGLLRTVRMAGERGMTVLPDLHNYAMYRGKVLGSADVPEEAFADVWRRLALLLKDEPAIWGYGLMNEPTRQADWPRLAQLAIEAIREVDPHTMIVVANDYAGWAATYAKGDIADWAQKSLRIGNPADLRDPEDNLVFELHTYFDHDNSGKYNHSYAYEVARVGPRVSSMIGVERLRPFSEWLKRHQVRGFIGEYSAPANPDLDPRWLATLEHTLAFMREHCLASTFWAAGDKWTPGYGYVIERRGWSATLPDELRRRDRPQTLLLQRYMEPPRLTPEGEADLRRYLLGDSGEPRSRPSAGQDASAAAPFAARLPDSAQVLLQDAFDGERLDAATWSVHTDASSWARLSEGRLAIGVEKQQHRGEVRSVRDDLEFAERPLRIELLLDAEATQTAPYRWNNWFKNYAAFSLSNEAGADVTLALTVWPEGFPQEVPPAWQAGMFRTLSASSGLPKYPHEDHRIDRIPDRIIWTLDATRWTLRIEGAEFTSGDPAERSGEHGLPADSVREGQFRFAMLASPHSPASTLLAVDAVRLTNPTEQNRKPTYHRRTRE